MWWLFLLACTTSVPDDRVQITVVRGDTLGAIAKAHGVTVDALRDANGLEGDLIEVGQRLWIPDGAPGPAPATRVPRTVPKPRPAPAGLARPEPKPCLPPPDGTDLGEEGMAASVGLSGAQVREVMNAHLQHTLVCPAQEASWPTGAVNAELVVSCDGTVASVRVLDSHGLAPETVSCVKDILGLAGFPAHDLPDGYRFTQPVHFEE